MEHPSSPVPQYTEDIAKGTYRGFKCRVVRSLQAPELLVLTWRGRSLARFFVAADGTKYGGCGKVMMTEPLAGGWDGLRAALDTCVDQMSEVAP